MALLKHGEFEFKNILSNKYKLLEDEPKILSEREMANGETKRNYGEMPKTKINVTFGRLDKDTFREYMSHLSNNEDTYSYYSFNQGTMLQKRFFVKRPSISAIYFDEEEQVYEEFEVIFEQCGVVS